MNVEIETEAEQFLFWEHINGIFVAVHTGVIVFVMLPHIIVEAFQAGEGRAV